MPCAPPFLWLLFYKTVFHRVVNVLDTEINHVIGFRVLTAGGNRIHGGLRGQYVYEKRCQRKLYIIVTACLFLLFDFSTGFDNSQTGSILTGRYVRTVVLFGKILV